MFSWRVPRMWQGGEVWIIGGGTSIPTQFGVPSEITEQVLTGRLPISAYNPYLSQLHGKHVIGVNIAFKLGPLISMAYFGDRAFFKRFHVELKEFKNLKVTHAHLLSRYIEYHRDIRKLRYDTKTRGLNTDPSVVSWNFSSGAAAINIAAHTGVKRILLLGYDMRPMNTFTHWHARYKGYRTNMETFQRFLLPFPDIAVSAKKLGIEILNVNPDSAINAFPKVHLKEVL